MGLPAFCVCGLFLYEMSKFPLFRRGGEQSNLSTLFAADASKFKGRCSKYCKVIFLLHITIHIWAVM